MKDTFVSVWAKTLNIAPEQLTELLYKKGEDGNTTDEPVDNLEEVLLSLDAKRVEKLKGDPKKLRDEGYQRAQREISEKYEKTIRETFGIKDEVTGDDLVKAAFLAAKSNEMPVEEKVKRSPLYLQLEQQYRDDAQKWQKEKEDAVNEVKAEIARANRLQKVKAKGRELLTPLNPANATERQINTFLSLLDGFDFETDENENIIALIEGEARKEDQHGNPYNLERFIREEAASFFVLQAQTPREGGGNRNEPNQPKPAFSGTAPKTLEELNAAYFNAKTPEERSAIATAFQTAQQ